MQTSKQLAFVLDEANCDYSFTNGVVLLSGGQDSMTVFHYARARHGDGQLFALGFDYGQRHRVELEQAAELAGKYDVPFTVLDVRALTSVGTSALTGEGSVSAPHAAAPQLPASFVPARNAMFFTLGYSYAQSVQAEYLYTGVCQTDYSGYPDCREEFVQLLNRALLVGYPMGEPVVIDTPLMHLTKAETFALADNLDGLEDVLELSHTCYEGDRSHRHAWGYGCGECPACRLRANGWTTYRNAQHNKGLG